MPKAGKGRPHAKGKHAKGKMFFADGRKYEGEFKNNKFHGQGKMTVADGRIEEVSRTNEGVNEIVYNSLLCV